MYVHMYHLQKCVPAIMKTHRNTPHTFSLNFQLCIVLDVTIGVVYTLNSSSMGFVSGQIRLLVSVHKMLIVASHSTRCIVRMFVIG